MSHSKFTDYIKLSPNYSSRNGNKISRITIHHMAGNLSVETCGNVFAKEERKASSTYGIDSLGRVGLYVEEEYRPWTSSSKENDQKAVTIEVANCTIGGNWEVSDLALDKLILLCIDICQRHGISELKFTGNPNTGNLTIHSMFSNTVCPGPYLKSKLNYIAEEVNRALIGYSQYKSELISVDGKWGVDTTRRAQEVFGTIVDGIISNQSSFNRQYLPNAYTGSWQFKSKPSASGSMLVKAMQELFEAESDGQFGPDSVKAMQRFLGNLTIDGYMGPNTVKEFQKWLNNR